MNPLKVQARSIALLTLVVALSFGASFGIALSTPVLPLNVQQALAAAPSLPFSTVPIQLARCAS